MERVIGILGSLLKQHSNPYANLTAQAQKMAHVNVMVAMCPSFDKEEKDPCGSVDLGDGYLLLGPKEDSGPYCVLPVEETMLDVFFSDLQDAGGVDWRSIYQLGRLKLPTEQIARSQWKEIERCLDMARTDCNVKVNM